jgi:SulP family sulfate permease
MNFREIEPKLITVLREGYSRSDFGHDLVAGVLVGIVALPLSIAFAIASGVGPEQGFYTAIIAGFLISAFSGSRFQIGGPTGAFIVLIYSIVQQYGVDGLMVATILAGLLLVVMGFAKLGSVIKFIPYPVTVGFTSGIALIILSTQLRDFFGVTAPWSWDLWSLINVPATLVGVLALLIILFWPRLTHRVPGSLVALLVTTAIVHLAKLPVETIGSRFGEMQIVFPRPHVPDIDWETARNLFSPAFAIALLAGIESLLSAVVADGMTGRKHRSNTELVAQGIANIVSPIFGGIPATGAIARTATNIKNGGRTPVAGMIHSVTLLLILIFFGRWAALIPFPALAAILIVVAYNMSEWRIFVKLFRSPLHDVLVLLSTFFLTVFVDLTVAIEVGVVLASFLFMQRMSAVVQTGYITRTLAEDDENDDPHAIRNLDVRDGVAVFEIYGPFFFGAADKFKDALRVVDKTPKVLILRMRHIFALDATGLRALEDVFEKSRREGTTLLLSGVKAQPIMQLERAGLFRRIGDDNVLGNIEEALNRAREIVARGL